MKSIKESDKLVEYIGIDDDHDHDKAIIIEKKYNCPKKKIISTPNGPYHNQSHIHHMAKNVLPLELPLLQGYDIKKGGDGPTRHETIINR